MLKLMVELMAAKGKSSLRYPWQQIAAEAGTRLGGRSSVRVTLKMTKSPVAVWHVSLRIQFAITAVSAAAIWETRAHVVTAAAAEEKVDEPLRKV